MPTEALNGPKRHVMKSIKQLRDNKLLTSNAMFASNDQDGSFKVLNPASLSQKLQEKKYDFGIEEPSNMLTEEFSVECSYAFTDTEWVEMNGEEFIVAGLDDGTVHLYDYSAQKAKGSKGFTRKVKAGPT